jgi:hypothetical protein
VLLESSILKSLRATRNAFCYECGRRAGFLRRGKTGFVLRDRIAYSHVETDRAFWANQSASSHAEKQLGVPGSSQSHLAGSYKAKGTSVITE